MIQNDSKFNYNFGLSNAITRYLTRTVKPVQISFLWLHGAWPQNDVSCVNYTYDPCNKLPPSYPRGYGNFLFVSHLLPWNDRICRRSRTLALTHDTLREVVPSPNSNMTTVRILPFWVTVWLGITSTTCTIDSLFVLLRPHTLPGGKWNYIFQPCKP